MNNTNWKFWLVVGIAFIALSIIIAITNELWVIIYIGVGFITAGIF